MTLEENFRTWGIESIRSLVSNEDYEPGWFDFKEIMSGPSAIVDSNRKVACAMANTNGGYLIFGVKDKKNRKPGDDSIVGLILTKGPDLRREFGHQVQLLRPGIHFDSSPKAIPIDNSGTHGVFVVQVPISPLRPHQWDGIFWKRGDGGHCMPMDVYEVRDQMLYTADKFQKLTLLRIELAQLNNVAVKMGDGDETRSSFRFATGAINHNTSRIDGLTKNPPIGR